MNEYVTSQYSVAQDNGHRRQWPVFPRPLTARLMGEASQVELKKPMCERHRI
jgi:hypothetical protein